MTACNCRDEMAKWLRENHKVLGIPSGDIKRAIAYLDSIACNCQPTALTEKAADTFSVTDALEGLAAARQGHLQAVAQQAFDATRGHRMTDSEVEKACMYPICSVCGFTPDCADFDLQQRRAARVVEAKRVLEWSRERMGGFSRDDRAESWAEAYVTAMEQEGGAGQ